MTEQEHPRDDYWNADEQIGEVRLWRGEEYSLRLKAHVQEEIYREGRNHEITPLRHQHGVRGYVLGSPYVLLPRTTLDVQLDATSETGGAVDRMSSGPVDSMHQEQIGTCKGWYYVADRTIILWEAFLFPYFRRPNVANDQNSYALWRGFECFLTARFPSATQIATTHDDPLYATEHYQDFLRTMGYRPTTPAAFGKRL